MNSTLQKEMICRKADEFLTEVPNMKKLDTATKALIIVAIIFVLGAIVMAFTAGPEQASFWGKCCF